MATIDEIVEDRWDVNLARALADDPVGLLVYRSNLLGSDLWITNFAGGNTSGKIVASDPVTGDPVTVLWVKGSGGDLGTLTHEGLAQLRMDRLLALRARYRDSGDEDAMVAFYDHCLFHPKSRAPSIDTPLHALIPARHVDHLHPDAVIAIAAARDGETITREAFGGKVGWLGWVRPGFELATRIADLASANPELVGVILGGHGIISWADTSEACYRRSIGLINQAVSFLATRRGRPRFGGRVLAAAPTPAERRAIAAAALPVLRGLASRQTRKIGRFVDSDQILDFAASADCQRLSALGTSCPDHFLRTKVTPLLLPFEPEVGAKALADGSRPLFDVYADSHAAYYKAHAHAGSPAMRDPQPVVILWPGIGMFTFAKDAATARIAGEYFINAVNVMEGAERLGGYQGLPPADAFSIEYWALEEAKLKRLPPERPLARRAALVSGAAGGIGLAVARRFLAEGAAVALLDVDATKLAETTRELASRFGADNVAPFVADLRDPAAIEAAIEGATLALGGLDLLVNNAGLSIAGDVDVFTIDQFDLMHDVMTRGSLLLSQAFVRRLKAQGLGGDILYIASKNAVVAGPSNVAYGSVKAAQAHQARLLAAELGRFGIRVNTINPDAVIRGSGIWAAGWAEDRARAHGVTVDNLPKHYAQRTLLSVEVLPEDVADAAFCFVGGALSKTTGAMLPVDGGIPAAFPR
ncbi:MAG: bifunctional rhamnulose-1-phosphate aldolase/short-chain dehydrogenase [Planctomycetes bacterium]|nr:bifunctional rhamnulose-1-phosphate aldolase/short-chain dehydrogenase [Alphaproteobacteria bacterium]MBM4072939.1 bifunctional rhamnulose-1-phosphate aldolase/short-chain dehydrogenase [Planctomycetota bacterium]